MRRGDTGRVQNAVWKHTPGIRTCRVLHGHPGLSPAKPSLVVTRTLTSPLTTPRCGQGHTGWPGLGIWLAGVS